MHYLRPASAKEAQAKLSSIVWLFRNCPCHEEFQNYAMLLTNRQVDLALQNGRSKGRSVGRSIRPKNDAGRSELSDRPHSLDGTDEVEFQPVQGPSGARRFHFRQPESAVRLLLVK